MAYTEAKFAVQIRVILTPKRRKDTTEYSDSDTSIHHGTIICLHENSGSSSYLVVKTTSMN